MHKSKINLPLTAILIGLSISTFFLTNRDFYNVGGSEASTISLEPYCKDGYYQIPNEPVCYRAPNCGGYSYDDLNTSAKMKNADSCLGGGRACQGLIPLCCYEMVRRGQFTMCIGYWERLWCPKVMCDQAKANGASNAECDGNCSCGSAIRSYCDDNVQPIPLETRLGQSAPNPTATLTPVQVPPTATLVPQQLPTNLPTATIAPVIPTNTPIPAQTIPTQPNNQNQTGGPLFNFPTRTPQEIQATQKPTGKPFIMPKVSIKDKIDVVKVEAEADKTLGFFEYVFNRIRHYDKQLETSVNSWFIRAKEKYLP